MKLKYFILPILFAAAAPAAANDTSGAVLPTGNIQFHEQKSVKLDTEALYMKPEQIEVNYIFTNTSDKDITEQIFFPVPKFDAVENLAGYENDSINFNFQCEVNGVKQDIKTYFTIHAGKNDITKYVKDLFPYYHTQPTYVEVDKFISALPKEDIKYLEGINAIEYSYIDFENEDLKGWAMKELWVKDISFSWQQTFPAGKSIHVKHTYTPSSYSNSMGHPNTKCMSINNKTYRDYAKCNDKSECIYRAADYFEYILKTAANWQMPINSFNLLVQTPFKAAGCFEAEPFYSKDNYYARNLINYTPKADFSMEFLYDFNIDMPPAPSFSPVLYKIDGPAALRAKPNGKKTGVLENNSYVWVVQQKKDWYEVLQNDTRGWTYKDNLINIWDKANKGEAQMTKPVLVTDETFDAEVKNYDGPVMAEFFATWCTHCQNMQPIINNIAKEYGNKIKICQVDVDKAPKAADMYNISGTPTMIFFKSKNDYKKLVGEQSKQDLAKYLDELLK